jgi:hypothetical protein
MTRISDLKLKASPNCRASAPLAAPFFWSMTADLNKTKKTLTADYADDTDLRFRSFLNCRASASLAICRPPPDF